jgi:hypothetical protein
VETAKEIEVDIIKPTYGKQTKHQCRFDRESKCGKTSVLISLRV